jgi:hypothetical protein
MIKDLSKLGRDLQNVYVIEVDNMEGSKSTIRNAAASNTIRV